MKNLFLLLFILFVYAGSAQVYVNQIELGTSGKQYIEVWEKYNNNTEKFYAMVDYGQVSVKGQNAQTMMIHDAKNNFLQFNNIIAILNYLYLNGWELHHVNQNDGISSYLLNRRSGYVSPVNRLSKVEENQ